jgi:ketosteroid isomerase-like protein
MRLAITSILLFFLTSSNCTAFVVVAPKYISHRQRPTHLVQAVSKPTIQNDLLINLLQGLQEGRKIENTVELFFQSWNKRDLKCLADQIADDCVFEDATFPKPFRGKKEINRHFRLLADATTSKFVLDDIAVGDNKKVAVLYHVEQDNTVVPNSRHCAFYTLDHIRVRYSRTREQNRRYRSRHPFVGQQTPLR